MTTNTKTQKKKSEVWGWLKAILIAFIAVFIIRNFLFAPYIVKGTSMQPTLQDTERVFVNKTVDYFGDYKRGQIIVLDGEDRSTHYVKRLIGLPGDKIEMKNDQLYVNGQKVAEPYLASNKKKAAADGTLLTPDFGPLTVPKGKYFVMGDNRQKSMDSRNGLGLFTKSDIQGTTSFVFYPFQDVRLLNNE
ncbi:Signal peptidase I [Bacillus pumilus]|uniref:signal peptidase I n=1 Tax=Bacillus pumilus TaxID=1408 RepID=UPI000DC255B0|nr:signal peptidase I [Bacillus pumilus]RAP20914.1 Signal peptidase I [Bacillus pumilus]